MNDGQRQRREVRAVGSYRRARLLAILATSIGCLGASPALAHFGERTDSLWGFVSRSDVIVVGRVAESRIHEEKGHTTAPGAVRLEVEETLLGAGRPEIGILIQGMHQPRYASGERVLVFAERSRGALTSLQSRAEKVPVTPAEVPIVEAVRRYAKLAAIDDARRRTAELEAFTLELLSNPSPRLHQDAVFDLSRPGLFASPIGARDLRRLAALALDERSPLVVREGIAAKLGVLAKSEGPGAGATLERLALEPANPAVRVAALNALRKASTGIRAMVGSLEADNRWVRLAAVEGLAALRASAAVPSLARRIRDTEPQIRFAARKALAAIGGPEADAALERARADASPQTRAAIDPTPELAAKRMMTRREEPR